MWVETGRSLEPTPKPKGKGKALLKTDKAADLKEKVVSKRPEWVAMNPRYLR